MNRADVCGLCYIRFDTSKGIRFSTYLLDPTSTLEAALVRAAQGGASVEVSLPSDSFVKTLATSIKKTWSRRRTSRTPAAP
jgi:hypothetical protein